MISANDKVNALHAAYTAVSGRETPLMPHWERGWLIASSYGLTPEDVRSVFPERKRLVSKGAANGGRHAACLSLRNWIQDEEEIANLLDECHELRARKRVRVMDSGKADVLRATGRPTEVPSEPAKQAGELDLMKALRKAAQ
jgi:hypothetical protein